MWTKFYKTVNSAFFFNFDKYTTKNDVFLNSRLFDKYELFLNKKCINC